jgi:hypothetical protein
MTTTLAPPPDSTRLASQPTHELDEDWPIGAIVALRPTVQPQHRTREAYVEPRRRFWLLDAARRDAVLGSDAAFLVSVAISLVLSGVLAYFYALWTIGPLN